jgi:hypothetical protein
MERRRAMNSLQSFYNEVMRDGEQVSPRGMPARALEDTCFDITPGQVYVRPGMNVDIGFIELLQWISGTFSIKPFERHAPKARLELFTYYMAYGPRTKDQMPRVIEELNSDKDSRRAVLMVARPKDHPEEMPCTLSLQFQLFNVGNSAIRALHTTVTMRSNDLVWGLPTDIIQFGGIAQVIAACTTSVPTKLVINCGNSHVYESTAMKEGEEFTYGGSFSLPALYTLDDYRDWAQKALSLVGRGITRPRYVCEYTPADEAEVEQPA